MFALRQSGNKNYFTSMNQIHLRVLKLGPNPNVCCAGMNLNGSVKYAIGGIEKMALTKKDIQRAISKKR